MTMDKGTLRNGHSGVAGRLGAGLVGALALTGAHQVGRHFSKNAPRMDVLGERALVRLFEAAGLRAPRGRTRTLATFAGDVLSNAGFYAALLAGRPRHPWLREILGGAAAGLGALALPPLLGLGRAPRATRRSNRLMTVAWYLLGGLASAAVYRAVRGPSARAPSAK